jgi:hypothetical protein
LLCALGAFACATPRTEHARTQASAQAAQRFTAETWTSADALFRGDPAWLGGDAAFSIELGSERVLWLFGDSFVMPETTRSAPTDRRGARMIRNSIGLQRGVDFEHSVLELHAGRDRAGELSAFFEGGASHWLWPAHGTRIGASVIVFLHRIVADPSAAPLGFRPDGVEARRILNPDDAPSAWRIESIDVPTVQDAGLIGAAVLREGGYVYAFGVRDPGDRALTLVRFSVTRFERGDLSAPEVWNGTAFAVGARAAALLAPVATELSVTRSAGGYALVYSDGFGDAPIAVRLAPALTGPFGAPQKLAVPHGLARGKDLLVYAGKAHAGLRAPAARRCALIATYATNTLDAERLWQDLALYYPRVLCLRGN